MYIVNIQSMGPIEAYEYEELSEESQKAVPNALVFFDVCKSIEEANQYVHLYVYHKSGRVVGKKKVLGI